MNCEATISVYELLGKTIHTREAADQLLQIVQANYCQTIELDFSGVEYMSRSFADQFHGNKLKLAQELQKKIIVANADDEIISMLQAVARTQNKIHRGYTDIPVYKYSNWKQLENFLLSI